MASSLTSWKDKNSKAYGVLVAAILAAAYYPGGEMVPTFGKEGFREIIQEPQKHLVKIAVVLGLTYWGMKMLKKGKK